MNWFHAIKDHLSRIIIFTLLMAIAILLLLYYFGVYDIAFIDRPKSWNKSLSDFLAPFTDKETETIETDPVETTPTEGTTASSSDDPVDDPSEPTDEKLYIYPSVAELQAEGYTLSEAVYDSSSMKLGALTSLSLSSMFSFRDMNVTEMYYYYATSRAEEYNVRSVGYRTVSQQRPILMLYMGYIIRDYGSYIVINNSYGNRICTYNPDEYALAYTRDTSGRPLFYKEETITTTIPAITEIVEGEEIVTSKASTYSYTGKVYYYLDEVSGVFVKSNYVDETDGRGLYFDYPSYFGIGDSSITKQASVEEKFTTNLKGKTSRSLDILWSYNGLTDFIYSQAYSFTNNRAITEYTYHLTRTTSSGAVNEYDITAMQILTDTGKLLFRPYQTLRYETWYMYEWYVMPDSYGEESLGFFYYDHGLTRARRLRVDYYFWVQDNVLKVMEDINVLLDSDGNIVSIPSGLSLEAYSDGMLLVKDTDGNYGYYDYQMMCVADPIYKEAKPFSEGLGVACNQDDLWGVIDTEGNIVIPFEYSYISQVSSGVIACYSNGKWTVFHKMTK